MALPVLALPALWPYTEGLPFTADGFLHLLRIVLLDAHVERGMLFPRWVPELVLGLGYPVFNFYGPSTFYVAELLHGLGLGHTHALIATLGLLIIFGGYGMYLLARAVLGEAGQPWPALAAAVAYMYSPYLLSNVFVRAAIGEVGAQALLPWIFWSFRALLRAPQPGRYVLPAALILGALACTHNITLLFLPPVLLAYLLVVWLTGGRDRQRLGLVVVSGLAAVGVSAFFWLPLIGERQYLANTAYDIARVNLPENTWTWRNFLDVAFPFEYTFAVPYQLGLVQLVAAVAGFLLARRRDAEWVVLAVLAAVVALCIGSWTIPAWMSSDVLLVAQFPWRLLGLVSVALALFTGGSLLHVRRGPWQVLAGAGLLALIILANRPSVLPAAILAVDPEPINLAAIVQFEVESAGLGTSSAREFMPRWAASMELDAASRALAENEAAQVRLQAASPYERQFAVTTSAPTQLRFTDFYYPGWTAQLETGALLPAYASTSMGLLTVDVPAGAHQVRVFWQDTPLRQAATWISLLTLAGLTLASLRLGAARRSAVVPGLLLAAGLAAALKPLPAAPAVQPPLLDFEQHNLELLGYRIERPDARFLYLYPYWHAHAHPERLQASWRLTDAAGRTVSTVHSEPYFSGGHTDNWPASTVVDDAYRLPLPPDLPAGEYDLWLALLPYTPNGSNSPPATGQHVGRLSLAQQASRPEHSPAHPSGARFAELVTLTGYDIAVNGRAWAAAEAPVVARPGDQLEYRLYWRALAPLTKNYHGLIHILDERGEAIIKRDQLAGSWFHGSKLWDTFYQQLDSYVIRLPADMRGGVYAPRLSLYDFFTVERLPVSGGGEGDTVSLPLLKIIPRHAPAPQHRAAARFEAVATLLGYDLALPEGGVRAGDTLTLTVYYRSEQPTPANLTRFVHVHNPALGMAGQADSVPQQGLNPTWSWTPGEVIVDQVVLALSPEAAPGTYTIRLGLYDPGAEGARLTVFDADGEALPDGSVPLADLTLEP